MAIKHAFKLAGIFKCEVAFTFFQNHEEQQLDENTIELIKNANPSDISYQIVRTDTPKRGLNNLIQQLEAIFILTQFPVHRIDRSYKLNPIFKWLFDAKIPTILLSRNTKLECNYKNIIIPVNYRKECKEKMIWASYFGRFNQAVLHLIAASEQSEDLSRKIKATLLFTKKMFEQFKFDYKIIKSQSNSFSLEKEAYELSSRLDSDLMVLMLNHQEGWFSTHFGPQKLKKYLCQKESPILFINPLKDYFLPCS
ncbi:hypothetical protein [Ancylomarina longa]|uniref:hypothetical protein n=1 Tax=Ancylomarina longa TaxID=2487017 RepID=UPI000FCC76B8|nr:hypothetical protein [Ancylomarina longa]